MRVHVKPHYQEAQELMLDSINAMLANGELDGRELAWVPGMSEWTTLGLVPGIALPHPPPLPATIPPPQPTQRAAPPRPAPEPQKPPESQFLPALFHPVHTTPHEDATNAAVIASASAIPFAPKDSYTLDEVIAFSKPHRWRRFGARSIDYSVCSLLTLILPFVWAGYAPTHMRDPAYVLPMLLLWVPVEALLLATLGTTPGKWFLRVHLLPEYATRRKPRFATALRRSFFVWGAGLGCGLPLISVVTAVLASRRLEYRKITSWDLVCRFCVRCYSIGNARRFGAVAFIVIVWVCMVLSWAK
jgi:hypothetical protein